MATNKGSGSGTGYGDGYGLGYGLGDGCGDGYGDGAGYGSSYYVSGYDYGSIVAKVGEYDVRTHPPFPVMSVGCQTHTFDYWREHWREIAKREGVDVRQKKVDEILRLMEER